MGQRALSSLEKGIVAFQQGKLAVMFDDEDRKEELAQHRKQDEEPILVSRGASAQLPTLFGQFEVIVYIDSHQR